MGVTPQRRPSPLHHPLGSFGMAALQGSPGMGETGAPSSLALEDFGRRSANVPSFLCDPLSTAAFLFGQETFFLSGKISVWAAASFPSASGCLGMSQRRPGQKNQGCSCLVLLAWTFSPLKPPGEIVAVLQPFQDPTRGSLGGVVSADGLGGLWRSAGAKSPLAGRGGDVISQER